ncbi:MAG TPA: GDP-mannose 4,6-dehydratase [Candidatus Krumholzibacteria bacterium]|nr:GDP-mannose 4,6-dehydratase [Candidatus Krumholzibacteria bacterium]
MQKALVTGCNGFVGRALVARLVADGFEVWGIDRTTAYEGLPANYYFAGDLRDAAFVARAIDAAPVDCIVHLAAQSSVRRSFDEPATTLTDGMLPALHILEHLRARESKARVLLVGSADEYGVVAADNIPIAETQPARPASPYALAKSIQNQAGVMYSSLYGADTVMTRSFNHTGPGQRDDFVLANFARQVAGIKHGRHEPVIEVGDLEVRRDFLDVRDVCDAYLLLLQKGRSGETYNVCSGKSYRIRDLLDRLCELAGVEVKLHVDTGRLRPVDMPELRGDPSKIREHTGWRANIDIEETLSAMLEDWEQKLPAASKDTK